jgi:hypothetical protein
MAFAAVTQAVSLNVGDQKHDHIFEPVDKDHYLKAADIDLFLSNAVEIHLPNHLQDSKSETEKTNEAMQDLIDFYNNQSENGFESFIDDMTNISDGLENDLRIWWGTPVEV